MRRVSPYSRQNRDLEIKMTPMIDVVFLLLVFFIWTASFQIIEKVMPSELSSAVGSEKTDVNDPPPEDFDFENVIVRIQGEGEVVSLKMNDTSVASLSDLADKLQTIAAVKLDAPVILYPDPKVNLGKVIEVYDLSRGVGFESISFAATPKG